MKVVKSGKNIVLLVLVLALALGFVWTAVNAGAEQWFNPTPEKIAEEFIISLAAHRYTGAWNTLSSDLQNTTSSERLHILIASIEAKKTGIQQALGEGSLQTGDHALAKVRLRMEDGSETSVQLPLVKENGLWKVSGLEDLWTLIFTRKPLKLFVS